MYFEEVVLEYAVISGPCYHGVARPLFADGGTASNMEGSCEYIDVMAHQGYHQNIPCGAMTALSSAYRMVVPERGGVTKQTAA